MSRYRTEISDAPRTQSMEDKQAVSIPANTLRTAPVVVCDIRTEVQCKPFLTSVNNAVSAGGAATIHCRVLVNGVPLEGYEDFQFQVGLTYDPTPLFVDKELPRGSRVQLVAWNDSTTTAYVVTGVIQVEHERVF